MNILHRIEKWVDTCMACLPRHRPGSSTLTNVCLIAHRGAHDNNLSVQENTHAAFERALDLGCYGIELDVHATADGVLVVNHDPTLMRLWGHDIAIHALTFGELRNLVPEIPSLAEVVSRYGKRMHLYIELKMPFVATEELARELQALTPCEDYHLLCLDEGLFPGLTMFPKEVCLLVPIHNNVNKLCKLTLQVQYGGILGHYLLLTNRQIKKLREAKQLIGVGFVDSKYSAYREINRGVGLLFTNNAERVASCLRELRGS